MAADNVTLKRIELLHPAIREEVKTLYLEQVVPALDGRSTCRISQGMRTVTEQDALYTQGRTRLYDTNGNRLGIVTNAKGGQSIHNYGLAFDIVMLIDGSTPSWDTVKDWDGDGTSDWMEVVNIFVENGWELGGNWNFKDLPHLQKAFGYDWGQLMEKYNAQDFIPGTTYVNL